MGTITNNALGLSYSSHPHLLKIRGVYYAFYFDNTDKYIKYLTSNDGGLTWSAPANASLEGTTGGQYSGWSVFYDGVYLYIGYFYVPGLGYACVRRGTPNIPLVWNAPVTLPLVVTNYAALIFCKTKNYVWVACSDSPSPIYVYKSSDQGVSWNLSLSFGSPYPNNASYPRIASLEQDDTDHVMIIYENFSTTSFFYRTFDGSTWSSEGTVGEKPAASFGPNFRDLWVANGELNFVYCTSASGSEIRWRHWHAGAWSDYTTVDGNTDVNPTLSNGSDKLRLFYKRFTNPTAIYYREMDYATHVWSDEQTLIASRPTNMSVVSSEKAVESLTDVCAVTWREGAAAPYSYLFTILQIASTVSGGPLVRGPWARIPRNVYQTNRPIPREVVQTIRDFFKLQTSEELTA